MFFSKGSLYFSDFYRLLASDKGLAIKIGQLQLKVVEGDICTENTDAILNYVNGDYSFKRGTIYHFRKKMSSMLNTSVSFFSLYFKMFQCAYTFLI